MTPPPKDTLREKALKGRLNEARALLYIHGMLTERESEKVKARVNGERQPPRHEHRYFTDEDGACYPCRCGEPFTEASR